MLVISKSAILIGEDSTPVVKLSSRKALAERGIDAKHKRADGGMYIVPLAKRLEKEHDAARAKNPDRTGAMEAIVIADAQTPYRVLMEVLYTLGQAEYGKYHLMVMKRAGDTPAPTTPSVVEVGELPPLARVRPLPAEIDKSLDLAVQILDSGYALKTAAGDVATGCTGIGDGTTVPLRKGAYDADGLARCAQRIKRLTPNETQVSLSADAAIPYGLVITTIDALRGAKEAGMAHEPVRQLFPDVNFALIR